MTRTATLDLKTAALEASPASASPTVKTMAPLIQRQITEDEICVLTFDRPDSSANLFDRATLVELNEQLAVISRETRLKGLILTSAKKSIFIAGADIHAMASGVNPEDMRELIQLGQSVFNRLASLSIPTVAAIHGACLGGGFEVCLACDYRIASPDRATKIGLPEVQLGILPAWGGSTRLPRLIGLPKALDIILAGKTLAAKPAFKAGMVDELVPREYLLDVARKRILSQGLKLRQRKSRLMATATNNALVAALLRKRLHAQILKETRGHYPAVLKALDVVTRGISRPVEESLALELNGVLELAQTEVCHNLIRVFFLQERAKKLPGTTGLSEIGRKEAAPAIERLAVIGAGVMGAGIAQWSSSRDVSVILRDINAEQVGKGMASIGQLYAQALKRHAFTKVEARAGLDRIFPATTEVPLANVDLVIEAAV